ncbi:hypothetical protein CAEBREN_28455 [Caenorhabditis brenneri]|uniref:Uncharacterized protein n=1 Tax=Caenorhabditis brenneri TaxID=135651 RepID=G0PA71_CAEBE|nr:hypothetical protein CAEBREN_28455 [Caenorhabditis brenneri]
MPTPPPSPMKLRLLKQLAAKSLALAPPPPPPESPPSKKTTISQGPVVPEGEMYIFRRQRIYDEHGKRVGEAKRTAYKAHLTGDKIILVDLDEDLVF